MKESSPLLTDSSLAVSTNISHCVLTFSIFSVRFSVSSSSVLCTSLDPTANIARSKLSALLSPTVLRRCNSGSAHFLFSSIWYVLTIFILVLVAFSNLSKSRFFATDEWKKMAVLSLIASISSTSLTCSLATSTSLELSSFASPSGSLEEFATFGLTFSTTLSPTSLEVCSSTSLDSFEASSISGLTFSASLELIP